MGIGAETFSISIHAPREGSDFSHWTYSGRKDISIHAPREGSDGHQRAGYSPGKISIHAPREGSDSAAPAPVEYAEVFQSTLPARGATFYLQVLHFRNGDFNPRSPRGERLVAQGLFNDPDAISIHAPREGSDVSSSGGTSCRTYFNPRSPRGERHALVVQFPVEEMISIHAPREGSDPTLRPLWGLCWHFNPRSPRGERPPAGPLLGRAP